MGPLESLLWRSHRWVIVFDHSSSAIILRSSPSVLIVVYGGIGPLNWSLPIAVGYILIYHWNTIIFPSLYKGCTHWTHWALVLEEALKRPAFKRD